MKNFYKGKDILVTGGTGSIGSEIVRQLAALGAKRIRVFDQNENAEFYMQNELKDYQNVRYLMGNIRDKNRVIRASKGVDIIFHAAAMKHVPSCEYDPYEAVLTNVIGTQNCVDAAKINEVEKFILISTDKAVNPINTMGASKLLAERLTINAVAGVEKTHFSSVRFGNVLNSEGSVIPLFKKQISKGGPITLTSKDMVRFVMSITQAAYLVLKTATISKGSEIFILKMDCIRIRDLAEIMIEEYAPKVGYKPKDIKIKIIGVRPGEKMYELLMTCEESKQAIETKEMIMVIPDLYVPHLVKKLRTKVKIDPSVYDNRKAKLMHKDKLRKLLYKEGVFDDK